jgi:hypothetical protein
MELLVARREHIKVGYVLILFLLRSFSHFIKLLLSFFLALDDVEAFLGLLMSVVEDVPSRTFRKCSDDRHERNRVYLHADDWYSPSPLVVLAKSDRHSQVDRKRHIQAEDIALELLCHCFTSRMVGGEL